MIGMACDSAFTAEIGVMQVNEEVDAMRVLGLDVIDDGEHPVAVELGFEAPVAIEVRKA